MAKTTINHTSEQADHRKGLWLLLKLSAVFPRLWQRSWSKQTHRAHTWKFRPAALTNLASLEARRAAAFRLVRLVQPSWLLLLLSMRAHAT